MAWPKNPSMVSQEVMGHFGITYDEYKEIPKAKRQGMYEQTPGHVARRNARKLALSRKRGVKPKPEFGKMAKACNATHRND